MVHLNYVYAIIDCSERISFGPIGIKGNEVVTLPCEDISAVISKIQTTFVPSYAVVETTEENWTKHNEVVMRLMKDYTVLPLKFGSLLKFERDLAMILQRILLQCREELRLFKGKIEVDVKVSAEDEDIRLRSSREKGAISTFKRDLVQTGVLMLKRHTSIGEAVEKQLDKLRYGLDPELSTTKAYYAERIYNVLGRLAVRAKADSLLADDMILNAHFLVDKSRLGALQLKLSELKEQYRDFKFTLSGLQAPYSFTRISYD